MVFSIPESVAVVELMRDTFKCATLYKYTHLTNTYPYFYLRTVSLNIRPT